MNRYRCIACGGEYDEIGADGMLYFHTCPPVTLVTTKDHNGQVTEQPLRALVGIELVPDEAERQKRILAGADPAKVWIDQARRAAPRKGARDERTLRREGKSGELRVLVAEGKGRTKIPDRIAGVEPVDDAP